MAGEKIIVAMSGGVDSSVAAAVLKDQGYQPIGAFMCAGLAAPDEGGGPRRCCSPDDSADARRVAARLGIPFSILDFAEGFERLQDQFCEEYGRGRTPNPCIHCNRDLKFGRLFEYADLLGAPYVATGHYARCEWEAGRWQLKRGLDRSKDQSYFLFAVAPERLERVRLPLGEMTKADVRRIARDLGLPVHDKRESQEVCFVPGTVGELVRRRRPDLVRPGPVLDMEGRVIGRHDGIVNFTIGQRRGLGIALGRPQYVVGIRAEDAAVIIGPAEATRAGGLVAEHCVWHEKEKGPGPLTPLGVLGPFLFRADVQIRYRHAAAPGWIARLPASAEGGERAEVKFDQPQPAVTPGQAAVFYRDDRVLGGGWIFSSLSEPRA